MSDGGAGHGSPPRLPAAPVGQDPAAPGRSALADAVRSRVLASGFDRVGIARARRARDADRFREWLERGYGADMEYLARSLERRQDPRRVLEGARSIIVTALHYRAAGPTGCDESDGDRGSISSYAQGEDYHRVMEGRLKRVSRELAALHPGEAFRYYVDTGPVLERAWAREAGVGWIGKNACAIDARAGSYFFIGSVITTMDLEPDPPAVDHCGSCNLCLEACPTGAIVEARTIDSRRCLSYLNIENRGPVPEGYREAMGNLVFGCDICQDVCPFNRPDTLRADESLRARPENVLPPLRELAGLLTEDAFRARFPRSAVRRARFGGFLRNVILAIGNSGRRDLLDAVERIAASPAGAQPLVAETIAWARRRLDDR